jgi:hypothetical protein
MTRDVFERLISITDLSEMLGVPIHTRSIAGATKGGAGGLSDWATCEVPPNNS